MEHTPHIRRHLEEARRALAPVAALLQQLASDSDRAAEDPSPETQAALAADLHRMLAALAEGADALLAIRDRLESGADAEREHDFVATASDSAVVQLPLSVTEPRGVRNRRAARFRSHPPALPVAVLFAVGDWLAWRG